MVQDLVEEPARQGRRHRTEEAHRLHYAARAQRVQLAEPPSGENELRYQVARSGNERFEDGEQHGNNGPRLLVMRSEIYTLIS